MLANPRLPRGLKVPSLEGTYLAPLVFMTRSRDDEIRRQAICAIANLADDTMRPTVAFLRNLEDRSVLVDLFRFTRPPLDLQKRKDAVTALTNLLRNRIVHLELLNEGLLPDLLLLSSKAVQSRCLVGRFSKPSIAPRPGSAHREAAKGVPATPPPLKKDPSSTPALPPSRASSRSVVVGGAPPTGSIMCQWDFQAMRLIVYCIACLCANENVSHEMLSHGFVQELVRLSFGVPGVEDVYLRRNAVHALTSLSFTDDAQIEIKELGGLSLATELLQTRGDAELRWQGTMLACNLCMNKANRKEAVRSPLLAQMLQSVLPPIPVGGEAEQLSLAIAMLSVEPPLLRHLANSAVVKSMLALIEHGSHIAMQHALWTLSNVATHRPTHASLLSDDMLSALVSCASNEGAPSRGARRDALRTLSLLCTNREVSPGFQRVTGVGTGVLLQVVVQCGLTSDGDLQELSLLILATWCEEIDNHAELVLGGVLAPIVLALQHPSDIREYPHVYAARAIACLSVHRYFRADILSQGAAAPLLELMRSPWPRIRCNAARAACNLSLEAEGALELLRYGGMSTALSTARAQGASLRIELMAKEYGAKLVSNLYEAWSIEEAIAAQTLSLIHI